MNLGICEELGNHLEILLPRISRRNRKEDNSILHILNGMINGYKGKCAKQPISPMNTWMAVWPKVRRYVVVCHRGRSL